MTTDKHPGNPDFEAELIEDGQTDDKLFELFSALDEVSASESLQEATIARIQDMAASEGVEASADAPGSDAERANSPGAPHFEAKSAGLPAQAESHKRPRWRAFRIAAVAACLAFALTGGAAYALPASYYEVEQGDTTITLGVNCFGITVSASANSTEADTADVVDAAELVHIPYEEAIDRAIEAMGQHDPSKSIEYGPRDGKREHVDPQAIEDEQGTPPASPAQPSENPVQPDNGTEHRDPSPTEAHDERAEQGPRENGQAEPGPADNSNHPEPTR